ncbi:MFS transporter [Streptomyces sp. NPDC020490]|uniref:MFS transporter n=1 Tax=Streptomyces sp. NPDC020490 TaxID=3365078 RepID=UPI0037AA4A38
MSTAKPPSTVTLLPVITGLSLAFTITAVDPLVLSLNMPQISRALHVPPDAVGFLGGASTLVVAAAVLAVGSLGDAFGLKRLLMLGLAGVMVVNLLSAVSPGYEFLLVMRFLDGLALAAMLGVSLALLKASVPAEKRPTAIGVFMAIEMALCGVTPAAGGWVVEAVGWRWLFLLGPLLSLISLGLTARYVAEPPVLRRHRLDVVGVGLAGIALLTLVYGIAGAENGFSQLRAWLPLSVSAAALVLFVLRERRTPEPVLDLSLFRSGPFTVAALAALALNFLAAGFSFALGQFGSVILSLSPRTIGLLYLPGTAAIAGAVVLAGRLIGKYTPRPVLVTGLLVLAASTLLMAATAAPTMALWVLVLATWLTNLGSLVASAAVAETILSHAPPGKSGTVASVQPAFGMTGYALGPAVYLLLLDVFFQQRWLNDAEARGVSVEEAEQAVDAARSALAHSPGTAGYDPNLLRQSGLALGLDFTEGLRLTMLVVSVLPLALAVAAHLLVRPWSDGVAAQGR